MIKLLRTPLDLYAIRRVFHANDSNRGSFEILVIDDEPFTPEAPLRKHGFNIQSQEDIENIDAVAKFPIVICDIVGVGKKFGSSNEGAHLLAEIRKRFPDKYLITNTGAGTTTRHNKDLRSADIVLSKDVSIDDWVLHLDTALAQVADPVSRWKRIRDRLLLADVPVFSVFELEQAFIRAIKKKDPSTFQKAAERTVLSDAAKEVVGVFAEKALPLVITGLLGASAGT